MLENMLGKINRTHLCCGEAVFQWANRSDSSFELQYPAECLVNSRYLIDISCIIEWSNSKRIQQFSYCLKLEFFFSRAELTWEMLFHITQMLGQSLMGNDIRNWRILRFKSLLYKLSKPRPLLSHWQKSCDVKTWFWLHHLRAIWCRPAYLVLSASVPSSKQ